MPRKKRTKPQTKSKNKSGIEQKVENILLRLRVEYIGQASIGKYTVDFLVEDKYIVECYGDFWHCNPSKYLASYYNKGVKKTAQEIWDRDKKRKDELESMGYKFICVWEYEINNSHKLVSSRIKKFITPK